MNFSDRLVTFMKESNIKQADICKAGKNKFTKAFLSMIINNKRKSNVELLATLSKLNGKSINWWLFGEDEYTHWRSLTFLVDFI